MMDMIQNLIADLNNKDKSIRLGSLEKLMGKVRSGEIELPSRGADVNNHIHTTYSFSPYSPSKAVWMALNSGLSTAGIMDHDSIGGAGEFIEAGRIAHLPVTIGVECRADFSATALNGRRINNPDQRSIAYVALHGIPHTKIGEVKAYFEPYVYERNLRNRKMLERINTLLEGTGLEMDFEKDIVPASMHHDGGSITERHLLYALSLKAVEHFGKSPDLLKFVKEKMGLKVSPKIEAYLSDPENIHYEYDLLGLLKSEMVPLFYIDAVKECPDIKELSAFSKRIGAILAYAYLGDVGDSVTGDKKAQRFEDEYIETLFDVLISLDFNAVTYMPSRNSFEQLEKVRKLCDKYSLFQISGEDINSSRQSFICQKMRNKEFSNLIDSTWALIGHEKSASADLSAGMFSPDTVSRYPKLEDRISIYKKIGLGTEA